MILSLCSVRSCGVSYCRAPKKFYNCFSSFYLLFEFCITERVTDSTPPPLTLYSSSRPTIVMFWLLFFFCYSCDGKQLMENDNDSEYDEMMLVGDEDDGCRMAMKMAIVMMTIGKRRKYTTARTHPPKCQCDESPSRSNGCDRNA